MFFFFHYYSPLLETQVPSVLTGALLSLLVVDGKPSWRYKSCYHKSQQQNVMVSNVTLQVIDRAVSHFLKKKKKNNNNPEAELSVLVKSCLQMLGVLQLALMDLGIFSPFIGVNQSHESFPGDRQERISILQNQAATFSKGRLLLIV